MMKLKLIEEFCMMKLKLIEEFCMMKLIDRILVTHSLATSVLEKTGFEDNTRFSISSVPKISVVFLSTKQQA